MGKVPAHRFNMSYDEVITKVQSVQPQFEVDLPQFTIFNPWFTDSVNVQLKTNMTAGLVDFSQSSHTAEIERQTEVIGQLLYTSGQKYQKLMYYVDQKFKGTKAVGDIFGHSRYEKARQMEKEMISLLNQACTAVELPEFKAPLLEAGMPESLPLELAGLSTELAAADGLQEMLKKKQLLVTSERINLFNSIWDTLSQISTAAKMIFADDPARLAIYQLYDGESTSTYAPASPEA